MSRYCAFKSKSSGQYYVFNSGKTGLVPIRFDPNNPIYLDWMNPTELNNLSTDMYIKLSNYYLEIYSDIEDDVYSVSMKNYGILQTTNTTQFKLTGYAGINSMTITGSNTSHVILSFDGRQTWVYYDSTSSTWKPTHIKKIFTSESNTVSQVNTFTKTIFDKAFKKHCTLDYAISITNDEQVSSVVLSLPENQPPVIIDIRVLANIETHTKKIKIYAHVDDMEGDNVFYEIKRTYRGKDPNNLISVKKEGYNDIPPIDSGMCNPAANGEYEYIIDPANFEIGINTLTFVYTDEKGKSASRDINIEKTNKDAIIGAVLNKDKLSYTIDDVDKDTGRYRILLNDKPIVFDNWSPFTSVPISDTIQLPWDKINFGVNNTLKIEFQESIYDSVPIVDIINFIGTYHGILFIDPSTSDPENGVPNKLHYYSDSMGETIKKLNLGVVTHSLTSKTYELGIVNLSDDIIHQAVINGFKNEAENYKVAVSKTEAFNQLIDNMSIHFDNIHPYDAVNNPEVHTFYVKLFSLDNTNWDVNNKIKVVGTVEPITQVQSSSETSGQESQNAENTTTTGNSNETSS